MTARTLAFPALPSVRLPRSPQAWRRALAFVGPGYLVAVGYMDPGNWAVDIAGGAAAGYGLLAVVLAASLAAMFVQDLVVRLTVATGRDLATLIRERLPRPLSLAVWLATEIAIVATELAELLGGAIAFKLLLGLPLIVGAAATAGITVALMVGSVAGGGRIERIVGALVAAVALGVGAELVLVQPDLRAVLSGFVPDPALLGDPQRLYLALGILGATVMPHNLYLHSGLVRDRLRDVAPRDRVVAGRVAGLDSAVALTLAFLVNAAILIVAGAVLPGLVRSGVAGADVGLEAAPQLIAGAVGGGAAAILFAAALLAAGQSSTITGALAGQLVMQGFLQRRLPTWLRLLGQRGAALGLAFVLLASGGGGDRLLVLSQVVLSLTLPAVLLPLAWLVSGRTVPVGPVPVGPVSVGPVSVGPVSIGWARRAGAWAFALILTGLNLYLLPGLIGA